MNKKFTHAVLTFLLLPLLTVAQRQDYDTDQAVSLGKDGVVRWSDTKEELAAFGVNLNTPFGYFDQRAPIGADQYKAIDEDVYHIARLGLDGYRFHIWDSMISDVDGNLIYNEHFKLYDYLHYKLKQRGAKIYLTPLTLFTSSGSESFANKYDGKLAVRNPEAYPAMANYLQQFLNHVNPYTGIAYKDDNAIVGLEIINEPSHGPGSDQMVEFINMMYDAIRKTGFKKPIFYNVVSCDSSYVVKSKVDGASSQWYPTGLTGNFDLKGNYLPHVTDYDIAFDAQPKKKNLARYIYEFSPADVVQSEALYSAMAREFREKGIQFASKFAYDPLHSAYCNVDFKTHFVNFAYTPQKAIGLMIAGNVFRQTERFADYGEYPQNNKFGAVTIDPVTQHVELNSEEKFLYTDNTHSAPLNQAKLSQVAGVGSSSVVEYSGTGLYILDKIEDGIWRLELMPDAFIIDDPYFVPHTKKEVAVTLSREQTMRLSLDDLGNNFTVEAINSGNAMECTAQDGKFKVLPGAYLLTNDGTTNSYTAYSKWQNITLGEYFAPDRELAKSYVLNETPNKIVIGGNGVVSAKVLTQQPPKSVSLIMILPSDKIITLPMSAITAYDYQVEIPQMVLEKEQVVNYYIQVEESRGGYSIFPREDSEVLPLKLRAYDDDTRLQKHSYRLDVVESSQPLYLLSVDQHWDQLVKKCRADKLSFVPSQIIDGRALRLSSESRFGDNVISRYCREAVVDREQEMDEFTAIEVCANSTSQSGDRLKVTLIMRDGSAYGGVVDLAEEIKAYRLSLSEFEPTEYTLHPYQYPAFVRPECKTSSTNGFNRAEIERVQVGIVKPGDEQRNINLEWIRLVKE